MVLDKCSKLTKDKKILLNAIDISTHWAKRCKIEFGHNKSKALFGIVQGGLYKDLREESIYNLIKIRNAAIDAKKENRKQNRLFLSI